MQFTVPYALSPNLFFVFDYFPPIITILIEFLSTERNINSRVLVSIAKHVKKSNGNTLSDLLWLPYKVNDLCVPTSTSTT